MSGKGSTPRPIYDRPRYEHEFDRIFGVRECTPIPQWPQELIEVDPDSSPDWHSKGI